MRRQNLYCYLALALLIGVRATSAADIEVKSVFIRLSDQVEVPAKAAGVLSSLFVKEGQLITEKQPLVHVEDTDANLAVLQAELEVQIATKETKNRINVEYATKSLELAKNELKRAKESRQLVAKSVSLSEVENLQLSVDRMLLDLKRSQHDLDLAALTRQVKQNQLDLAKERLARHRVVAPLSGIIVEVYRKRGEWVEPGEKVMRILRLDRLRAEGFVNVRDLRSNLMGAKVTLSLDQSDTPKRVFHGTITFVDPEVEPTTAQVRIRAEIDNQELHLRPGLRGSMIVHVP